MATFFDEEEDLHTPYPEPSPNKLRGQDDFILKELKLIAFNGEEYDISPLRVSMNIFEDLFENTVSGNLSMVDAVDLFQTLPLIGEEKLKVVFTRPEPTDNPDEEVVLPDYTSVFRVYKVSNRQLGAEKAQVYILHFASEDFIKNLKTKIQKSFKGIPYSRMVEVAFSELGSDKPIEIEQTKFDHDWAVPNLYPFEFINSLAARSISAEGNGSAYLFYSDRDSYHFKSLGYLLTQEPSESYTYQLGNIREKGNTLYRDQTIAQDLKNFHSYGFSGTFDVLYNMANGMYASRLQTYDLVREIWDKVDFDYVEQFDEFKHLDKYASHTEGLDALGEPKTFIKFLSTDKDHDTIPWIASKEPGIKPNHVEEHTLHRYSQLRQLDTAKVASTVSGDPRRKIGQIVEYRLPQAMGNISKEHPEELDKYLSGKYLIVSLVHRIKKGSYFIEMEMVKDTFFNEIAHIDPVDLYKDIY